MSISQTKKKQISFLDKIYENQEKWITGSTFDEINNNLKKMVKSFGINNVEFDKCVNDDIIADRILNSRIEAHKKYSIDATPTIVINDDSEDTYASRKRGKKGKGRRKGGWGLR